MFLLLVGAWVSALATEEGRTLATATGTEVRQVRAVRAGGVDAEPAPRRVQVAGPVRAELAHAAATGALLQEDGAAEPVESPTQSAVPESADGAAKSPAGGLADEVPGGPGGSSPHVGLPSTWSILQGQPYLLALLLLGTLVLTAVFCLSLTGDDDPLRDVLATVPLTPLALLPHREYQIVKTAGAVTVDKTTLFNSPLTSELCVYSRTRVEQHTTTGWVELLDFVEARPFALAQKGSDLQILCEVSTTAPAVLDMAPQTVFDGDLVQLPPPVQQRIRALPGPKLPAYSMFRVSEWTLTEGQELVAMGLVLRRVSRKETRTAIGIGGLSATNCDSIASLFSPMRVGKWRHVGNKVVLGLASAAKEEEK